MDVGEGASLCCLLFVRAVKIMPLQLSIQCQAHYHAGALPACPLGCSSQAVSLTEMEPASEKGQGQGAVSAEALLRTGRMTNFFGDQGAQAVAPCWQGEAGAVAGRPHREWCTSLAFGKLRVSQAWRSHLWSPHAHTDPPHQPQGRAAA